MPHTDSLELEWTPDLSGPGEADPGFIGSVALGVRIAPALRFPLGNQPAMGAAPIQFRETPGGHAVLLGARCRVGERGDGVGDLAVAGHPHGSRAQPSGILSLHRVTSRGQTSAGVSRVWPSVRRF